VPPASRIADKQRPGNEAGLEFSCQKRKRSVLRDGRPAQLKR